MRDSVRMLRRCARMREWRGDAQQRLNATPFRTSADPVRYACYVDATLAEWDTTWAFTGRRRVRKIRFRDAVAAQRLLDIDRLCEPRDGDRITLLLYGSVH